MDFTKEQTKEIRRRIIPLIAANGLKMRDFYEKSGVSSSLFSQYGTGKSAASMLSVQRMANAVNADIDFILDGIENHKEKSPDIFAEGLSDEEKRLIQLFRYAKKEYRDAVLALLESVSHTPKAPGAV